MSAYTYKIKSLQYYGCILILFISSMRSMYFSGLGASLDLLSLPLIFLFVLVMPPIVILLKTFNHLFIIYFFLLIACLTGLVNTILSSIASRYDTALALFFIPFIIFYFISFTYEINWHKVISKLIVINILLFYFQLFAYYFLNFYFDPIELLTGNMSRNITPIIAGDFGYIEVFRASGLFDEPGTFTSTMAIYTSFLYVFDGFKIKRLTLLALSSMLISLSALGIITSLIIIIHSLLYNFNRRLISYFFILTVLTFLIITISYYFFWRFGNSNDSSLEARSASLLAITQQIYGMGFIEPITGTSDWGVFPYLYLYFGIFSLPLMAYFFYVFIKIKQFRIPLFMMFISKIPLTAPLFWILFFYINFNNQNKVLNIKNDN